MNRKSLDAIFIIVMIIALTTAHYITPPDKPILHDIYRRLYYVPIVWASIRFGLTGGLLASVTVSLVFLPHVIHRWGEINLQTTDALFEILLYNAIAWVTGVLADTERAGRDRLEKAHIALVRTGQMKALAEIAAGMAHEVRNPLASLRGGIELISKETSTFETRSEVAAILIPEIERIEEVIRDFLSYARPPEPVMEELDVAEVTRDALALLRNSAPEGVVITLDAAPDTPRVLADMSQLRSIIVNLSLNAIAAVSPVGHVNISIYRIDKDVVIEVKDDGHGAPPEIADKIFTPFFTTKKDGHGLGLSVVSRIVESHCGAITFESRAGEGATFKVRLKGIIT